jgi:hypothetical protein
VICVTQEGRARQDAAAVSKTFTDRGASEGPREPMPPRSLAGPECRPYITGDHAALSPSDQPDPPVTPPPPGVEETFHARDAAAGPGAMGTVWDNMDAALPGLVCLRDIAGTQFPDLLGHQRVTW